eukprot:7414014-Prorocentrum_lima.AAC.1
MMFNHQIVVAVVVVVFHVRFRQQVSSKKKKDKSSGTELRRRGQGDQCLQRSHKKLLAPTRPKNVRT